MSKPQSNWLFYLAIAACIGGVLWYSADDIRPLLEELRGKKSAPAQIVTPAASGPRFPIEPSTPDAAAAEQSGLYPLPPLAESDGYFRAILLNIFGDDLDTLLANNELIAKFVATVDGLDAAKPSRKVWPVKVSLAEFQAVAVEDASGQFVQSPENYARFDFLITMATHPAPATLIDAYKHLYPLFQETYIGMGYPDGYFNDRLVEIIDHLLSTPQPAEPILLVQPRVYYQFADPKLEALSGGQKLLIRMGPANAAKLRPLLQAIRQGIVE